MPKDMLYSNLFGRCQQDHLFALIAQGLSASCYNAERLLSDACLLHKVGKLSSARFLLTTAQEEIAKSYILVDMCRVDLNKHENVLHKLCGAFYDHISKQAYFKIVKHNDVNSMDQVKAIWKSMIQRWTLGDYESGEPDMPHDTYFNREFPLYIDYSGYEGRWLIPTDSDHDIYFNGMIEADNTPITETENLINLWKNIDENGICLPAALEALNIVFKGAYVREGFMRKDLDSLYRKVAEKIGISFKRFMASPLAQWPLYNLV